MRPAPFEGPAPIELKFGIKTSLPKIRSAVALTISLWKSHGQMSEILYSTQSSGTKIEIKPDVYNSLLAYFGTLITDQNIFKQKVNNNPLLSAQIEPLKVAFELIWKLGVIDFEKSRAFNSERTGNIRYTKKVRFTKNIDMINLVIKQDDSAYKSVLLSWIMDKQVDVTYKDHEVNLISLLTLLSEEAIFRLRIDENNDVKFINHGIYTRFQDGSETVDMSDYKEITGPLRILRNIISEDLHFYIKKSGNNAAVLRNLSNLDELKEYAKRIESYLPLHNVTIDADTPPLQPEPEESIPQPEEPMHQPLSLPHNRIIVGAPGTGKSFLLEEQRAPFKNSYVRVTFHPSYSYAQFVGTYRPKPKIRADGTEFISYEFVAGPFLRMLAKATLNPGSIHLIIIEEINRANVAAVFGDVFQLLDRVSDGTSEYPIATSDEMYKYLVDEGLRDVQAQELKIPGNLYIWATMNSADQGVHPIDTAFKRRWDMEFISIDHGSEKIEGELITLHPYGIVKWNSLRTQINDRLIHAGVNEDKLIGPFFLKSADLHSSRSDEIFKSKVIMYLYNDVVKNRGATLFSANYKSLSQIMAAYDDGKHVFNFDYPAVYEGNGNQGVETPEGEGTDSNSPAVAAPAPEVAIDNDPEAVPPEAEVI